MRFTRGTVIAAAVVAMLATAIPSAHAVPTTKRVSVGAGSPGTQANGDSFGVSVSSTGRYVAFSSLANNLVPGDTNNTEDVFVRDTTNNTIKRVSVVHGAAGAQGKCEPGRAKCNGAHFPSISGDGRYVSFESDFNNLVAGDTNNTFDHFVRDTVNNTTVRVSVTNTGGQTRTSTFSPSPSSISNNGQRVVFVSDAKEYAGEGSFTRDAFVRDLAAGTTTLVSITRFGGTNVQVNAARISGDGKLVAFDSADEDIISGDNNGAYDVFVRNLATRTSTRVSVSSSGAQGNGNSLVDSISTTGAVIGFNSSANNLVTGDTNNVPDAFVRKGTQTIRVNVSSSGAQGNNKSICAKVSGDGRYVAFCSIASNLVPSDTNAKVDAFVRDLQNNTTVRVSVTASGGQGNNDSPWPAISGDGKFVAFETIATNLVPSDTNGRRDIVLRGPLF